MRGLTVVHNTRKAVELLRKAAKHKSVYARYELASCYQHGEGVTQSYSKAFVWFGRAAKQGHAQAQYMMATCCYDGVGTNTSTANAVAWLHQAATQGHIQAHYVLGLCLYFGIGKLRNEEHATTMFRYAAIHGHGRAQYNLGALLQRNGSVANDYVRWYKKSAARNIPEALYILGWCYATGQGVHKHYAKADRLYNRVADFGCDKSHQELRRPSLLDDLSRLKNQTR
jgi:TPR repeat protein